MGLLPFAGGSQSVVEEFGGGAELGKCEVRSKNGANGMSDIEGKAAGIAASECGQRVSFNYES